MPMAKFSQNIRTGIRQEVSRQIQPVRKDIRRLENLLNSRLSTQGTPIQLVVSPGVAYSPNQGMPPVAARPRRARTAGPQAGAPRSRTPATPQVQVNPIEILLSRYRLPIWNYDIYADSNTGVAYGLEDFPGEIKPLGENVIKAVINYERSKKEDPRVYAAFLGACLDDTGEKSRFADIQFSEAELAAAQINLKYFDSRN